MTMTTGDTNRLECTCDNAGTCEQCKRVIANFNEQADRLLASFDGMMKAFRKAPLMPVFRDENREQLGMLVRHVWIKWAQEQPNPKPSWLVPWIELSEADRDVDRRIGVALYTAGFIDGLRTRTG